MCDMAQEADRAGVELPERYWSYLRAWVALGVIAFVALVVVFHFMIAKPI
jgi:uncharacterized membrane protein